VARFKDKGLFCFGVRIQNGRLTVLVPVPSRKQAAAVSVTAAYVEVSHHFLRAIAERYLAHAAHNPLSCSWVADTEQGSFASPKKKTNKSTKKMSRLCFPICKAAQRGGGSRESPFLSERSQRRERCCGQAAFLLLRDVFGVPCMG